MIDIFFNDHMHCNKAFIGIIVYYFFQAMDTYTYVDRKPSINEEIPSEHNCHNEVLSQFY